MKLEGAMAAPDFWERPDRAREIVQRVKLLKNVVEPYDRLTGRTQSAAERTRCSRRSPTAAWRQSSTTKRRALTTSALAFELRALLSGTDDQRDAQLEISAGAGGTEDRIGRRCSCVCTRAGLSGVAIPSTCST